MPRETSLQRRIADRPPLIALLQTQPNPTLTELAALTEYDVLILDDEHGVLSASDMLHAIQLLAYTSTAAWVRIRASDPSSIGRYVDMGADGIVVPGIDSAEQAAAIVRAFDYPPRGSRGFGASVHRGTRYGGDLAEHLKDPRGSAALMIMIESPSSVSEVEKILALEGVDGAIVGPSDLSANLGCLGDFSNPTYLEALARIEKAAASSGKMLGTAPHAGHPVEALVERGHRFLIVGADTALIRQAMCEQVAKARSESKLKGGDA